MAHTDPPALDPSTISDPAPRPVAKRSHRKKTPAATAAKPAANPTAEARLRALEEKAAPETPKAAAPAPARSRQAATLRKGLENFPSIDILERRLLNPEGTPSEPIRLRGQTEPMELRWVNTEIPGRYHEITRYAGYVPVKLHELADPKEVSDLQESPDGVVTRGERGKEVLMKIPKRYYDAIQRKRAEIETRKLRSSTTAKRDLQEAAASQAHTYTDAEGRAVSVSGDEAAHGVGQFFGEIKSSRETIAFYDEEQGA